MNKNSYVTAIEMLSSSTMKRSTMSIFYLLCWGSFLLAMSLIPMQQASGQVGLTAAPFLRIEPDARASALGGAGVTLLDEGFGGYYNPASLGWQRGISAGFSYSNWLAGITSDVRYNRFAGTYALDERSSVAASLSYVNLGQQMATDDRNAQLGAFSNYQMATTLSYGRKVGSQLAVGVGLKHIYSSLGTGQVIQNQIPAPKGSIQLSAQVDNLGYPAEWSRQ